MADSQLQGQDQGGGITPGAEVGHRDMAVLIKQNKMIALRSVMDQSIVKPPRELQPMKDDKGLPIDDETHSPGFRITDL